MKIESEKFRARIKKSIVEYEDEVIMDRFEADIFEPPFFQGLETFDECVEEMIQI